MNFNQYSVDFSIIFINTKSWIHYPHVYGIFHETMPYAMKISESIWRTLTYAKFQIYNFSMMENSCMWHILKNILKKSDIPQGLILIGLSYLLTR